MDASAKYKDLPGIAHDQPDVYETSDQPESDQPKTSTQAVEELSSSVDILKVVPSEAFQKFEGSKITVSGVDFSSYPFGNRGYQSWGNWEVIPREAKDEETPLQKYRRLQTEVQELEENLRDVKISEATTTGLSGDITLKDITHGLEDLRNKLQTLDCEAWTDSLLMNRTSSADTKSLEQLQQILKSPPESSSKKTKPEKEVSAPSSAGITYELRCRPEQTRAAELAALNQLEQKVRSLEVLLGEPSRSAGALSSITDSQTVMDAVQVLSKKVALLDPHHLDHLETRLSSLLQKLSSISEKKSGLEESSHEETIKSLVRLLEETQNERASLPSIVSRLNDLSIVEEQALQFSAAISFIDNLQSSIASDLKTSRDDLKSMKESLSENMKLFEKTMQDFEKRINSK